MKTLFALLIGAVLGTATALWLAARSFQDQPPAEATSTSDVVPRATPVTEEASA